MTDERESLFASSDTSRLPNSRELRDYIECMSEIAARSNRNDAANILQVAAWLDLAVEQRRCYAQVDPRRKCWAFAVRGYDHCRHHLTPEERQRREREKAE